MRDDDYNYGADYRYGMDRTLQQVLAQEVTTGNYAEWPQHALIHEITHRRLAHGVNERSFPDADRRKARLAEILTGNDNFRKSLEEKA